MNDRRLQPSLRPRLHHRREPSERSPVAVQPNGRISATILKGHRRPRALPEFRAVAVVLVKSTRAFTLHKFVMQRLKNIRRLRIGSLEPLRAAALGSQDCEGVLANSRDRGAALS